jgi:predicted Rossmann fold flavoprotein
MTVRKRVIVVGGGASGMVAAGRAAECGADVLLLEKTPRLGNKLRITGKGRCNVTNVAELSDFVMHFGENGRFLYGALSRFFVDDLRAFLEARGVPTKVERGGRVFPASDDARQVSAALEGYLLLNGVQVRRRHAVEQVLVDGQRARGVKAQGRAFDCCAVVLATGGASYPRTGSTGDGYRLAAEVGHRILPIRPALVPLVTRETWVRDLQGLSLRNVWASLLVDDEPVAEQFGEMVFTHFGLSGPVVLTLSKRAVDALTQGPVALAINLKPALSRDEVDRRLRHELDQHGRQQMQRILTRLLPKRLIPVILDLAQIPAGKRSSQINVAERTRLAQLLQGLPLTVVGSRPLDEAIVTAGGVDTGEIDPRTMESRLVKGLFFCGEVIDVDADTGGYNLQAAFSTGHLAGESAAAAAAAVAQDVES